MQLRLGRINYLFTVCMIIMLDNNELYSKKEEFLRKCKLSIKSVKKEELTAVGNSLDLTK
jgi:hypothetical protein